METHSDQNSEFKDELDLEHAATAGGAPQHADMSKLTRPDDQTEWWVLT